MPFIGAAITPHSPLLLPSIGKEYHRQTKKTQRALKLLSQELYALQPDLIVVVHPHGSRVEESFVANVAEHFSIDFSEFGDLVTKTTRPGDLHVTQQIKQRAKESGIPLTLIHQPSVPYDVGAPLTLVASNLTRTPIIPLGPSTLDRATHVNYGRMLVEEFHHLTKRVYVLVSAELSHHTTPAAPGGARPEGEVFDRAIVRGLGKRGWENLLLRIDESVIELASSCGYLPLLMLAGIVARHHIVVKKLVYESPFGIGLLTASFHTT